MLLDSDTSLDLRHQPLPSVAYDLRAKVISAMNTDAERLFQRDLTGQRFDRVLKAPSVQMAVFLEAVLHFGRYIDNDLEFCADGGQDLQLQIYGTKVGEDQVLLSFLDLDAQERRTEQALQDAHQRAGITQWQHIYGFFQEIEAQNQLILDAAGEGIYGINAEGKATFVNRAAQEMLGWNAEELIGRELHSIIHHHHLCGDNFPANECPIYDSFRHDKTIRVEDDAFWRKDGKPILVEYVSTPIYDHGMLAGAVVIFRDVTARKENEKKLRQALQEVEALRDQLEQENDYLLTEIRSARSPAGIIGASPAARNLDAQIRLVADTNTNVLISGEPGTGKSLAVTAIHEASGRSKRPLVRVNCSDVSLRDLEADVFGARRGATRSVTRDTTGKLTLAHNGTLHLDEVSDLPKEFQAKLRAALNDGMYRRLGDVSDLPLDVTVVSTTTRDLTEEVQAGRFRQDLYFALSVFPIRCSPLKDRPEDIPYLAKHFLDRANTRLRLSPTKLTKGNINALLSYNWPGNVRELESVIERAAILSQGGKLKFEFEPQTEGKIATDRGILTNDELRQMERNNLIECLRRSSGKVSGKNGAAQLLKLAPTTVYSKIKSMAVEESDWAK
ncbi:sigma 54-interacting transcriptional regulator [Octadecabacter sp. CECT 8868]|uniref:sigma 54-interacting transcriptional regulator n=1 Tax=Octadecabacter algicola TaxID=2909342 RepID=UPI001F437A1B|nr:sigma 54-interacting transcriptional regulator [Octadecabacter algicola]MCF2905061.1 sigma 54-interacting transcriptional regulator [Octadecabacter algicola]